MATNEKEHKKWSEKNGRFSRKHIRLCKVRLHRLCSNDKWRMGFTEKHIFGIIK